MVTTTIKLQDFTSYSPVSPVTISLTKPVAVFYGHNGTGKSSIARALRHHANAELGAAGSSSVLVKGLETPEFLIYDSAYVEENFHQKDGKGIRGIFTLGKKTADELEKIKIAEDELQAIKDSGQKINTRLAELSSEIEQNFSSAKDSTWQIKSDYEKGPLRFCLEDNKVRGDKSKLFSHLTKSQDADGSIVVEDLLREALEAEDETAEAKSAITYPTQFSELEAHPLLGSVIAASSDSRLSDLVSKLKNESWIRTGLEHLDESNGLCPLCQQDLPHDFSSEISKLFDTAYEEQCKELKKLRDNYADRIDELKAIFDSKQYQDEYVTSDLKFQNECKDLRMAVEANLAKIDQKIAAPADPVNLDSSLHLSDLCRQTAAHINSKIADYNARIANRASVRHEIDNKFWRRMRHDHAHTIASFRSSTAKNESERNALDGSLKALRNDYKSKDDELKELRRVATNIDASVDAINKRISDIGIRGFTIERDTKNDGYYHIARGSKGKIDYRDLSEGEKSLVTFLYFMESLYGSHTSDGAANRADRIVVIDDPISSLSHNHVYDIAALITVKLIEPKEFPQIIILTHSMFFYHELFKASRAKPGDTYQCFRVTKNEFSDVREMPYDHIKNDYQSFWLVLKEGMSSHTYSVAIPIAMRYILEHYFSFIGTNDKLGQALTALGDSDKPFFAFYRYMNRQSHADNLNISDLPSVDPSIYLEKFKKVFEITEQLQHFDRMIGS